MYSESINYKKINKPKQFILQLKVFLTFNFTFINKQTFYLQNVRLNCLIKNLKTYIIVVKGWGILEGIF